MREIKFRVWSFDPLLEEPEMLQWEDINRLDSEGLMHLCDVIDGTEKNVALMQFTGLYDTNKKPIYEGDIDVDGGVVVWNNDHSSFHIVYEGIEEQELTGADTWMEVIGNKFENPELLKPTSESDTLPK